uniref:hypothetical protein n=1 Tax=uncultured Draconibacterium sp. TaxID=1573823 RepID=UPI003216F180
MKKLSLTLLLFSFIFGSFVAIADNDKNQANHDINIGISKHALVGLSSSGPIELSPAAPTEAGMGLDFNASSATDNSLWLNYSSITGRAGNTIDVAMAAPTLPKGVGIELVVAKDAGKGKGKVGEVAMETVTLGPHPKIFIKNIKNGYTGKGEGAGHQLTYRLTMDGSSENYEALTTGAYTVRVTYTITSF